MAESLTFTLSGNDHLSRVLNGTGDAADRLALRLAGLQVGADGSLRDLQGRFVSVADAQARLAGQTDDTAARFRDLSDASGKLGEALRANLISLAPAAIPAAAGLASSATAVAGAFGAVAVAAGAYALALGPQIAAISEALEAQQKYEAAVEESGAGSAAAAKAQAEYQQQLAKLPPATREAAIAVGLLKDNYQEWSDSLSGDVMAPFTKGIAVTNALLPKTTGLVEGASGQFDRLITLVGGAISTPGFDALTGRFTNFTNDVLDTGVDKLTIFLAKLDAGEYDDSGLSRWMDYAQAQGPLVWDTLANIGDALLNVLEAGAGVGVGMLEVLNVLSAIVSAVPPEAIALILQLSIAIKAVSLATAGGAAAGAAIAAISTQVAAMRTAATGTPGVLAGTAAAIGTLSRTAKIAMAGTGIGLLLIAMTELSQMGEPAALDVDKLTTSLGELGRTGEATGYVASQFGDDFEKLREQIQKVMDPSIADSVNDWGASITNDWLEASDATREFTASVEGIDQGLADLVSGGKADLAAAALASMTENMSPDEVAKFTGELDKYSETLAGQALEQKLAAESMGLFGDQAQEVQAQLDAQKTSADGLRESIVALNEVNRSALDAQAAFEASIDTAAEAAVEFSGVWAATGGTLDLTTESGRSAYGALSDLAAKTNEATTAARESGASWSEVSATFESGRQQLIANAQQMGLTREAAAALADQILNTPDKTAYLRGDLEDLKDKLADAKARLAAAPSSKTAAIKGEISDLQRKVDEAQRQLDGMRDRTLYIHVATNMEQRLADAGLLAQGGPVRRAQGGPIPGYDGGGLLSGPGTPTSDSILLWGSDGEFMMRAAAVDHYGEDLFRALNAKTVPLPQTPAKPGLPARSIPAENQTTSATTDRPPVTYNVYPRASVISAEDLRLLQRQEEARQRVGRPR